MSKVDETKKAILDYVEEKSFVRTTELAQYLNLTPQSIRRYTKELSEKGLLTKFHGGLTKNNYDGMESEMTPLKYYNMSTLQIDSVCLVFIAPLEPDPGYQDEVETFLVKNTRVDPVKYILHESRHKDWAVSDADKLLRKLTRSQIVIFSETVSPTGINLALLASNRGIETFLVCKTYEPKKNITCLKLQGEGVKLFTLERFKSDWKYARV